MGWLRVWVRTRKLRIRIPTPPFTYELWKLQQDASVLHLESKCNNKIFLLGRYEEKAQVLANGIHSKNASLFYSVTQ